MIKIYKFSNRYGYLGSIDANTGSPDLGWDTDQFPMDIRNSTMVMKTVLEQVISGCDGNIEIKMT